MKHLRLTFSALFAMAVSMQTLAQRENILINQDWNFRFSHQVDKNSSRRVDLPHTWNAQDALSGKPDYKRGIGNYCLLYTSPSPRDAHESRMPSSA